MQVQKTGGTEGRGVIARIEEKQKSEEKQTDPKESDVVRDVAHRPKNKQVVDVGRRYFSDAR